MKPTIALATALAALCAATGAWPAATMHTRVFTGSGTFTIPSNIKTTSEFQFTVVGGGGGAGGCHSGDSTTSGGGSGGAGFASFSGFNPSDVITLTVGSGGPGGNTSGSNGVNGGNSKLTYSGIDIVTGTGGQASAGEPAGGVSAAGSAGTFSATAGSTTLTLQSSLDYQAEDGTSTFFPVNGFPFAAGGNPIGHGGTLTNHNGALGGGALGCFGGPNTGGAGGGGVVIITWSP
jgi:hypothetical protein